jgi:predicted Na+-dependent transporter
MFIWYLFALQAPFYRVHSYCHNVQVFNAIIVYFIARMPPKEAVAVIVMASQKSAPVAVTAITFLTNDIAVQGLLSLPCIVGQLAQVFSGAVLAPFVARRVDSALEGVDSGLGDQQTRSEEKVVAAAQQKRSVAVDAAAQLNGSGEVGAVL